MLKDNLKFIISVLLTCFCAYYSNISEWLVVLTMFLIVVTIYNFKQIDKNHKK